MKKTSKRLTNKKHRMTMDLEHLLLIASISVSGHILSSDYKKNYADKLFINGSFNNL